MPSQYFDLAICGARKPGFLLDPYLPLFQVRTEDASLVNIEVGSDESAKRVLRNGKVFQGGNWNHLHRLLDLRTGSDLMYVGDHMYSDILRSKRTLGWRTVLILPELESEIQQAQQSANLQKQISSLRGERADLDISISELQMKKLSLSLRSDDGEDSDESTATALDAELQQLREKRHAISDFLTAVIKQHHMGFHPQWGQLFKAGHQNSRWAQQVQEYACLYTSHASNLAVIAPDTRQVFAFSSSHRSTPCGMCIRRTSCGFPPDAFVQYDLQHALTRPMSCDIALTVFQPCLYPFTCGHVSSHSS